MSAHVRKISREIRSICIYPCGRGDYTSRGDKTSKIIAFADKSVVFFFFISRTLIIKAYRRRYTAAGRQRYRYIRTIHTRILLGGIVTYKIIRVNTNIMYKNETRKPNIILCRSLKKKKCVHSLKKKTHVAAAVGTRRFNYYIIYTRVQYTSLRFACTRFCETETVRYNVRAVSDLVCMYIAYHTRKPIKRFFFSPRVTRVRK